MPTRCAVAGFPQPSLRLLSGAAAYGHAVTEPDTWRVLLVDDHRVVRAGLRAVLESDPRCRVVAEAGSLDRARVVLRTTPVDLVVLDLTVGTENGLDLLPDTAVAGARVVVLTMHADPALAQEALSRGADGYVLKEAAAEELVTALEVVAGGGTYLVPQLGARIARQRPSDVEALTARERDVLRLLAEGHTNTEVAGMLHVSVRTVEAHRASLRSRLGAQSRADLVAAAHRLGL